jgi:uncharacterized protein YjaG (DUF416 family)
MSTAQEIDTQVNDSEAQMPSTIDMVNYCLDRDAVNASDTLSSLLGPRLVDAIQAKKVEVAQSIYGTPTQDAEMADVEDQSAEDAADETEMQTDTEVELEDETEEENENA